MGIPCPDELREVLAVVAARIDRYRNSHIGEQNTKVSLIMPILRALGWNTEDLDEVRMEFRRRSGDRPVDFALMLQREPVLFVEAKALEESLDDRRWSNQVISYAAVAGVEWVVLTNGDEYRVYNAHAPVPVDEKLFRKVRIVGSVEESCAALSLLSKTEITRKSLTELWRSHSIDERVRRALRNLFGPPPDRWLVRRLARDLDDVTPRDVGLALSRARITLDFPSIAPTERGEELASSRPARYEVTVRDLIEAGLVEPGTTVSRTYLGQTVSAQIEGDGRIRFQDEVFESLSEAAGMARVAVKGPPSDGRRYYQTNGWTFWKFVGSDGVWREMDHLRQRLLRAGGTPTGLSGEAVELE